MPYKTIDGVDYQYLRFAPSNVRLERWSKKWLKAILVALIAIEAFAVYSVLTPTYSAQDLKDYSIVYANLIK